MDLLRMALKRDPDNVRLKLELADALNTVIRIKTNANSLVIEGTQDCPAFKKIWGTLGREVRRALQGNCCGHTWRLYLTLVLLS